MLTIVNILKLEGQTLLGEWKIQLVYETTHNNCYVFEIVRDLGLGQGLTIRRKIMLEREGRRIFGQPELSYFFIKDSQRTNICVSADYIADKDNMVHQLEGILLKYKDL
jgi:hypothetical protein